MITTKGIAPWVRNHYDLLQLVQRLVSGIEFPIELEVIEWHEDGKHLLGLPSGKAISAVYLKKEGK